MNYVQYTTIIPETLDFVNVNFVSQSHTCIEYYVHADYAAIATIFHRSLTMARFYFKALFDVVTI